MASPIFTPAGAPWAALIVGNKFNTAYTTGNVLATAISPQQAGPDNSPRSTLLRVDFSLDTAGLQLYVTITRGGVKKTIALGGTEEASKMQQQYVQVVPGDEVNFTISGACTIEYFVVGEVVGEQI